MSRFWESSPEWQREQELAAELKKAQGAMDEAGAAVLVSLRMGNLDGPVGRELRADYLTAHEAWQDAYVAWREAFQAYRTSSAGQAERRYFADPIARASAPAVEEVA